MHTTQDRQEDKKQGKSMVKILAGIAGITAASFVAKYPDKAWEIAREVWKSSRALGKKAKRMLDDTVETELASDRAKKAR